MKKLILIIIILVFVFTQISLAQQAQVPDTEPAVQKTKKTGIQLRPTPPQRPENNTVTVTYFLKHISPEVVQRGLRYHFWRMSGISSKKMITVQFIKSEHDIKEFEKLLKKLDVPKRTIHFRIFTIIASSKSDGGKIENKDLNKVLKELQKLLSFKNFKLDGVSLLTLKDGSERGSVLLSSSTDNVRLSLRDISINHYDGKNHIEAERMELTHHKSDLLRSQISIKENGYLVAGVSKIGRNGDSLVLVINALIK